jgi:GNAT superfamily N-acetyltransferase
MAVWLHFDDGPREPRERLYASLGLAGDRPLRHYLAWLNCRPVGVSQLFLGRGAAGLYCVATLRDVRHKGIGTAITLAPLQDARALGYHVAVLAPSREAQSMYRRIGFELWPSAGIDCAL